jgi:hypothetical protein
MQYINVSIRKHPANGGGASREGSGVPISPRHESRDAIGAVATAEEKGGAGGLEGFSATRAPSSQHTRVGPHVGTEQCLPVTSFYPGHSRLNQTAQKI